MASPEPLDPYAAASVFRHAIPFATPLDMLAWYWEMVLPEDRLRFLVERVTPAERRALASDRINNTAVSAPPADTPR